jgi:hypothetical protein
LETTRAEEPTTVANTNTPGDHDSEDAPTTGDEDSMNDFVRPTASDVTDGPRDREHAEAEAYTSADHDTNRETQAKPEKPHK